MFGINAMHRGFYFIWVVLLRYLVRSPQADRE